jgi:hypothetical protein
VDECVQRFCETYQFHSQELKKKKSVNLEMHVALDIWGMADICGTAVDLFVEHALGVNNIVANNCCV